VGEYDVSEAQGAARKIWPVVLSGGSGTRLWPLSRSLQPKQFLRLGGERTLIQATVARTVRPEGFEAPVVIGNAAHLDLIRDQLGASGSEPHLVILEPVARNTAPAIALAAHQLHAEDPGAIMLVMPSDHVVRDAGGLVSAARAALAAVEEGWLVTFGIEPSAPETGYGYIRSGDELAPGVHRVEEFVEKPDLPTAQAYLAQGGYYWNGGIFLFRADRYLEELARLAPDIHAATARAAEGATREGPVFRPDESSFAACPSDSIDYAVMERADRVAVVPIDVGWSDIGSWDALREIGAGDADGNVAQGPVLALGTSDCLLRSEGPLIAAVGVSGLTVVATDDAVMLAPAGRSQDVKLLVEALKKRGGSQVLELPTRIAADWGEERLLSHGPNASVRELRLNPGARLSRTLPTGARLTVLDGSAARIGGDRELGVGHSLQLGAGTHEIEAAPPEPLVLLELTITAG
jgi:mannose-1-phosphate guanylyltransferase